MTTLLNISASSAANLKTVLRVMAPDDNLTGGGAASAIAGAMAAGLVGMVARLSAGRKGLEPIDFYEEIDREARMLSDALFDGATRDAEAFARVMAALKLPRGSESQRTQRSDAVQSAYAGATWVPVENGQACARTLRLYRRLVNRCNPNAASDLENARFLAQAGLSGCIENISSNLKAMKGNSQAAELKAALEDLVRFDSEFRTSGGSRPAVHPPT